MTTTANASIRDSRFRIPRTRGGLGGITLVVFGAWAGIVAFIGPYLSFAFTPASGNDWYWTAARGYLEVIPGAAAVAGGLLLLFSAKRVTTMAGGWLAIVAGAWLVIGPQVASIVGIATGSPAATPTSDAYALGWLFYFYAVGGACVLVAALTVGRLSIHAVRDVKAAERRLHRYDPPVTSREPEDERVSAQPADEGVAVSRFGT